MNRTGSITDWEDAANILDSAPLHLIVRELEAREPSMTLRVREFINNLVSAEPAELGIAIADEVDFAMHPPVACRHCRGAGSVSGTGSCAVCFGRKVLRPRRQCRGKCCAVGAVDGAPGQRPGGGAVLPPVSRGGGA